MDRTKIILRLSTHRWIGPMFLVPPVWFFKNKTRLVMEIRTDDNSLQLFKLVFLKQTHLQLVSACATPKIYVPAVEPSARMRTQLDAKLAKNRLWVRHANIAAQLPAQHILTKGHT